MARPRERDEVLTEIFKFRLSKRQNEILGYLADLNHLSKGRFLRKIIDQATQAGSTTRVINQLTKPVLAHERMCVRLHTIGCALMRMANKLESCDTTLACEVRQSATEALAMLRSFREYVRNEL